MYVNLDPKLLRNGGRKAPKMDASAFKKKLLDTIGGIDPDDFNHRLSFALLSNNLFNKVWPDIQKLKHVELNEFLVMASEFRTGTNGVPYLEMRFLNANTIPFYAMLYFDGKTWRGYVPFYGNTIDTAAKAPFDRRLTFGTFTYWTSRLPGAVPKKKSFNSDDEWRAWVSTTLDHTLMADPEDICKDFSMRVVATDETVASGKATTKPKRNYYFAILDKPCESYCPGVNRYVLVWNTKESEWLNDKHLPRWLDSKLSSLGWSEMCEAYCEREDDGTSRDDLIKAIESAIPEMKYSDCLKPALNGFSDDEDSDEDDGYNEDDDDEYIEEDWEDEEDNICPVCGAKRLNHGCWDFDDDHGATVPWKCPKCGATGKASYKQSNGLHFDRHLNVTDKDGNAVEVPENDKDKSEDDDEYDAVTEVPVTSTGKVAKTEEKYYFAISDECIEGPMGFKWWVLVWNTNETPRLNTKPLPDWLNIKFTNLGWGVNSRMYGLREYDGMSRARLIHAIESAIPGMRYSDNLRPALKPAIAGFLDDNDDSYDMPETTDKDGICPVCGAEIKYLDSYDFDDDGATLPWECPKCGANGKAGYNFVFDRHYCVTDKDGNDVRPDDP